MAPIHNLIRMANGLDVEPTGESLINNNIITNGTLYIRLQKSTSGIEVKSTDQSIQSGIITNGLLNRKVLDSTAGEIDVKSTNKSTTSRIITNGSLNSRVQDSGILGRDTTEDGDNSLTERGFQDKYQQIFSIDNGSCQNPHSKNHFIDFSKYLIQEKENSSVVESKISLIQGKAVDPNPEDAVLELTKYLIKKNEVSTDMENTVQLTENEDSNSGAEVEEKRESTEIVKDLIAMILEDMIFSDDSAKNAESKNLEARNKGTKLTRFQRFRQAVKNFKTAILRPFTSCVKIQDTE